MKYTGIPEASISSQVFEWIETHIPFESVILEIGSGYSTKILSENYKLISVEQNMEFVDRYDSEYIYAPLAEDGFYEMDNIVGKISPYDVCIIDGPARPPSFPHGGRRGILKNENISEFRLNYAKVIIVDDIDREPDYELYSMLSDMFSVDQKFTVSNAGIIVLDGEFVERLGVEIK